MRLLLDTHAVIWWLDGDPRLSLAARGTIDDQATMAFVSVVSVFEITTKFRLGKLAIASEVIGDLEGTIRHQGFLPLSLELKAAERAGLLPGPYRDPFDRLLIAQAITHDLALVSNERAFDAYGVRRLW